MCIFIQYIIWYLYTYDFIYYDTYQFRGEPKNIIFDLEMMNDCYQLLKVVINIFKKYGQECIMALTHYSHLTELSIPTKNHYEKC